MKNILYILILATILTSCSEPTDKVIKASNNEDIQEIVTLVEKEGQYINVKNSKGLTPLLQAVEKGDLESALFFLEKGAQLSETNNENQNALSLALSLNNKEVYETLLDHQSVTNTVVLSKDTNNKNALDYAIEKELNFTIIKKLLDTGVNLSEKDDSGLTLLMKIANDRTYIDDITNYMLTKNIVNQEDNDGNITLTHFLQNTVNSDSIIEIIGLTYDINEPNKALKTPLMFASQINPNVAITKLLIDSGADLNAKNENEWTALMYAARYNENPLVFKDLLIRGATAKANSAGLTILMLAACNPNPGVLFEVLQSQKDTINNETAEGKTALDYAFENKMSSYHIELLIDAGAIEKEKSENEIEVAQKNTNKDENQNAEALPISEDPEL